MAPPRKHDTDVILDAARALALADGPRAATVAAIARASGAPQGSLYHRFGSRDAILAAAWLRALRRFQERALAAVDGLPHPLSREDAIDAGVGMAAAAVAFARGCPDDARLLLAVRRDDLLDRPPTDDFRATLAAMNEPLFRALTRIARAVRGRADARSLDRVTRAVVDLPQAAVRRHADRAPLPRWLEEDVSDAARLLLGNA